MSHLGRHAHAIAPDLLGHGQSAMPRDGDYSLVLVASGGFGREVTPALRMATLPGAALARR